MLTPKYDLELFYLLGKKCHEYIYIYINVDGKQIRFYQKKKVLGGFGDLLQFASNQRASLIRFIHFTLFPQALKAQHSSPTNNIYKNHDSNTSTSSKANHKEIKKCLGHLWIDTSECSLHIISTANAHTAICIRHNQYIQASKIANGAR